VYNLGLDEANMNKLDLCNLIKTQVDFEIMECETQSDPDKRNYTVSSKKIMDIGFEPVVTLDMGVTELIKAYTMFTPPYHRNA
jgi:nucleoside-diphosphate-sugar epimerase